MRIIPPIRTLLFVLVILTMSAASFGQVAISISFGPPPLPVYEQPLCPEEGYIWTPGYWAYDYDYNDYYWVPGTWVPVPEVGFLWTPGYWGWNNGGFVFYEGYWGPQVGFYGGIDYDYGYFGNGYEGGRWENGRFFYNRAVNNVNVTIIHNVYNTTVINRTTVNRVSYNGGNGGISARPTPEQEAAARQRHIPPVAVQTQHMQEARRVPEQRASVNHGKPAVAASPKPADFKHPVPAREAGGSYNPPANRGDRPGAQNGQRANGQDSAPGNNNRKDRPRNAVHPSDLPRSQPPAPPNTGNANRDQKAQRDQEKLIQKQDAERQKLQQKQDQEHQRLDRQKADDARRQQIEQQHQQQTQKLEQRQNQQQQKWQEKHQPQDRNRPQPPK
jgi:hypothetical protein